MGNSQIPSEVQLTVAPVAAPVSSTSAKGEELLAPFASFQFGSVATPAISLLPIDVPVPTKSMLMALTLPPSPEAVTIKVTVAVSVSEPLVPVIVIVELPGGVLSVVATVRVELPDVLIEVGLNEYVAPDGSPLALRFTDPLNPFAAPTTTVYVAPPPELIESVLGVAVTEKSVTD